MKMDLRISIKHYHHASVWREFVAFRAGEMQPGAGDTSSRQTEADATAPTDASRDERAEVTEGGPERSERGCRVTSARWSRRMNP